MFFLSILSIFMTNYWVIILCRSFCLAAVLIEIFKKWGKFWNYRYQLERNSKTQTHLLKKATNSFISTKVQSGARSPFAILQFLLRTKALYTTFPRLHKKSQYARHWIVQLLSTDWINTFNPKNHYVRIKFDRRVRPALTDRQNIDH